MIKTKKQLYPVLGSLLLSFFTYILCILIPVGILDNDSLLESYMTDKTSTAIVDNIVLINIAEYDIEDVLFVIEMVDEHNPKVIALDMFLPELDSIEKIDIRSELVLTSEIKSDSTIEQSSSPLIKEAHWGFVDHYDLLYFNPFSTLRGQQYSSFTSKILEIYSPFYFSRLKKRNRAREIINYHGNINSFRFIDDITEIKNTQLTQIISNRIVILGWLGTSKNGIPNIELCSKDDHYTPHSYMFGSVVLANELNTLFENYLNDISRGIEIIIIMILNILIIFIMNFASLMKGIYYYLVSRLMMLISAILIYLISAYLLFSMEWIVNYKVLILATLIPIEISYWFKLRDLNKSS